MYAAHPHIVSLYPKPTEGCGHVHTLISSVASQARQFSETTKQAPHAGNSALSHRSDAELGRGWLVTTGGAGSCSAGAAGIHAPPPPGPSPGWVSPKWPPFCSLSWVCQGALPGPGRRQPQGTSALQGLLHILCVALTGGHPLTPFHHPHLRAPGSTLMGKCLAENQQQPSRQ